MKKDYITLLVFMLVGISIYGVYHKGYKNGKKNAVETIIERRDTIYQFDTITRLKPVYLTSTVVDSIPYPVPVPGTNDTVWAQLPRTEREYGDSTYYALVAGVEPELKRIDIFRKTEYINNTVYIPTEDTRKDYIELDARFGWMGQLTAPITLNIGHKYGLFDVYAGGGYDPIQRSPIVQVGGRMQFKW